MTVHAMALSDHEGVGRFAVPMYRGEAMTTRASLEAGANKGFEEVVHEVELARLDSLGLEGLDVIKIDVEGHEASVIEGAQRTLARERPTLIVEIEERHHVGQSEAIIGRLMGQGYQCVYLSDGRVEIFRAGSISELQPKDLVPLPGSKAASYINNFIFIPDERSLELKSIERFLAHGGMSASPKREL